MIALAVSEGVRSANPNSKSLFEHIVKASSKAQCRRLLVWSASITAASIAVKLLLPSQLPGYFAVIYTIMLGLELSVGFGGAVYFFSRFVLSWKLRHLLSAAAFSAIGSGVWLEILAGRNNSSPHPSEFISAVTWAVAMFFFACSAYSHIICHVSTRGKALTQALLSGALLLFSPLIATPYIIHGSLSAYLTGLAYHSSHYMAACIILKLSGVLFCLAAFYGLYRRSNTGSDRLSGLLCFVFVPLLVGLVFRCFSAQVYDNWWIASSLIMSASWLVFIGGFCVENAVMLRDSQDRLQELDALHQVSWSVVGAGSLHQLLDMFARTHCDKLGAKVAAVYLVDENQEHLELYAISGPDDCCGGIGAKYPIASTDRRPGFHTGHTVKAFTTKEVQIANDVFVDVEFIPWRIVAADDGCAVSLPLVTGGKAIGVVNLYYGDCRQLTRQRLRMLSTITGSAAPAIANALAQDNAEDNIVRMDLAA